jgi:predicted ATPase
LVGQPGAYRPARDLHALLVPPTVGAVLAARVDRLSANDRRVLQAAAVIGKEVPLGLLETIADVPEAVLGSALTSLQAGELLRQTRLLPETAYTFKHALTHEVAYGTLAPDRRRTFHTRLVEALEQAYAGRLAEQVEELARHAVSAELWPRAVVYCREAGAKAALRSAHREARQYFEQALEAIGRLADATLEERLDLHRRLRWSLVPLGEYARLAGSLREASALAERLGDQHQLGEIAQSKSNRLLPAQPAECRGR